MAKKDKAQQAASGGALSSHVAVSQLITFLTRMPELDETLRKAGISRHKLRTLLSDDEIYQACETRFDALNGVPIKLEPSEGDAADFLFAQLEKHMDAITQTAFDGRLFGYAVAEFVADVDDQNRIGCGWFGIKPMQWFEPKPDGTLRYFPDNGRSSMDGLPVDQDSKFCLIRCKATWERPHGEALLSRLYWPWFFRTHGWQFWAKFLERFGSPILVGNTADSTTQMRDALLAAHGSAVLGIGENDKVQAIGAGSGNSNAFEAFESALLRRIQKVVLGQTLTSGTDGGSGNRALGNVHNDVRMDKRNSDLKLVQQAAQWFVDVLCHWNGWERHFVSFGDERGLEEARAKRDKDLHEIGVRFTRKYLEDEYNLRAEDFEIDAPPLPIVPVQASLPTNRALTFADDGTQFTPEQQEVETLADDTLQRNNTPIPRTAILAAIEAAEDEADLGKRLMRLMEQYGQSGQFADDMTGALFMAEVMGYVHGELGK